MRRFILLAFIGVLLMQNVTSSIIQAYPSNLAWLFGLNDELNKSKEVTQNVCKTQECEKIAKVISESMDKSVDPCDDFYEYACGKWPEHNPIPKGNRKWSLFYMLQKKVDQQVHDIVKEKSKNDVLAVKLAKKWYEVCMNTDAMDKQGLDPLIHTLSRIGGWPMIMDPDEWDEKEYSWQKVDDQYVRLTGNNVFHKVHVNRYSVNKTVKISAPNLPSGTYKLWLEILYDSDEIEDEDPSDEQDRQEFGNEDDDDDNSENNDDDDSENDDDDNSENDDSDESDDDDNSENDDNDDSDDDTNEQSEDKNAKKKISERKSKGKFNHKKNIKMQHNRKTKSSIRILKKHDSHKTKKQRIKRQTTSTKIHGNRAHHPTHREKFRKSKRNHVRKAQDEERMKKTLETVSTTPQISTEETNDEGDETAQQVYANYISKVARAIAKARGIEVSEEHIDKDIEDMIKFQVKLAKIVMDSEEKGMELTLNDFQEWYDEKESKTANSKINWVYKVAELFDEAHVPVDGDLNLEVDSSDYFEALVSLLDETSARTIVNYIHWNFLSKMIEATTSEMRNLHHAWEEWGEEDEDDEEDEEESEEEWRSSTCMRKAQLRDILAYEYVRRYFSDKITKTAEDMVDDIQKEVEYQIKESDWLDEKSKDYVLGKLINMRKYIGYPDWYRNNTIVKRYFQGLIIGKSYYENMLSYSRYQKWKQLRELKKNDEDEDDVWWMDPLTVNAFFAPWGNAISLSVADFQSPFFAYARPQAINYGIVGVIMGHEVNHGFDDDGIFYDKNGERAFVEWLSIMSQEYSKRANCFVEQFNNYPLEKNSSKKIENYGNRTSGENIADTMGLQASFRAYQRRRRECEKLDTVLPNLKEITNDQLFFLSFANVWCEATIDLETLEKLAKMDVHSTGRLRVIGSVSNSEDFAKAFNCPVGSAMNPEGKCNIWK